MQQLGNFRVTVKISAWTIVIAAILAAIALYFLFVYCQPSAGHLQLQAQQDAHPLPPRYAAILAEWTRGYWFWRIAYTLLSAAAVSFPALIAAGVPRQENRRQIVAASAAAIIAITTFMQAGEKATAHEHAYLCMELATAAFSLGQMSPQELQSRTDDCSKFINYDYIDVENSVKRDQTPRPEPETKYQSQ